MEFVDVRDVVHGRGDDERMNRNWERDVVRIKREVVHQTVEHRLYLFVREARERCSADLGNRTNWHSKQQDYFVWPQSACGHIGSMLRFEHQTVKYAWGFNRSRSHRVVGQRKYRN